MPFYSSLWHKLFKCLTLHVWSWFQVGCFLDSFIKRNSCVSNIYSLLKWRFWFIIGFNPEFFEKIARYKFLCWKSLPKVIWQSNKKQCLKLDVNFFFESILTSLLVSVFPKNCNLVSFKEYSIGLDHKSILVFSNHQKSFRLWLF